MKLKKLAVEQNHVQMLSIIIASIILGPLMSEHMIFWSSGR